LLGAFKPAVKSGGKHHKMLAAGLFACSLFPVTPFPALREAARSVLRTSWPGTSSDILRNAAYIALPIRVETEWPIHIPAKAQGETERLMTSVGNPVTEVGRDKLMPNMGNIGAIKNIHNATSWLG
jgi:hypothetical protein